jgi:DNA-binding LacI/PurR family transcriptional regulator
VDGIIIFDGASGLSAQGDVPIVCVGHANEHATRVILNKRPALEEAIDHFIDSGVKEIGFLGEKLTVSKEKTFREILLSRGATINENFIRSGERFADGGYATVKEMIADEKVPRAIICAYDYLAIGAIRALTEAGYRIPEDVALIGMDDIPEAQFLNPPLSSINSNKDEACEAAADTLINMLMGRPYEKSTFVRSTLHKRRSSEI